LCFGKGCKSCKIGFKCVVFLNLQSSSNFEGLYALVTICYVLAKVTKGLIHERDIRFPTHAIIIQLGLCIPNIGSKHIVICHSTTTLRFLKEFFAMARFNRWTTRRFMCLNFWMQVTLNVNKACSSWLWSQRQAHCLSLWHKFSNEDVAPCDNIQILVSSFFKYVKLVELAMVLIVDTNEDERYFSTLVSHQTHHPFTIGYVHVCAIFLYNTKFPLWKMHWVMEMCLTPLFLWRLGCNEHLMWGPQNF
jgi:hypothetical protein